MSTLTHVTRSFMFLIILFSFTGCVSTSANWKEINVGLACVKGPIKTASSETNPNTLNEETRIKILRQLETEYTANSDIDKSNLVLEGQAFVQGLRLNDIKISDVENITERDSKFNSLKTLLSDLGKSPKSTNDNGVLLNLDGMKSASNILINNDACIELNKIQENSSSQTFNISKESFKKCMTYQRDAIALNGWEHLSNYYAGIFTRELKSATRQEVIALQNDPSSEVSQKFSAIREAILISGFVDLYIKAYFNNGSIFAVDLNIGNLRKDAEKAVNDNFNGTDKDKETLKNLVDKLLVLAAGSSLDSNGKIIHLLVKKDNGGFVTRDGVSHSFSGVTLSLDPKGNTPVGISKIDMPQVASDLMRVFIEATGDALAKIPGDPKSTGVLNKDINISIPLYTEKDTGLKPDDFSKVNEWGNTVEGTVGAAVGEAIRGIGWIALNNETLAKLIETSVAVSAKKGIEKVAWCYYASKSKPRVPTSDALRFTNTNTVRLNITQ